MPDRPRVAASSGNGVWISDVPNRKRSDSAQKKTSTEITIAPTPSLPKNCIGRSSARSMKNSVNRSSSTRSIRPRPYFDDPKRRG